MAKWLKDYNPQQIAEVLEKTKSEDKNGRVSFQGFASHEYSLVLNRIISLNQQIPQLEKNGIVHKAIFKAGGKGKITADILLKEIRKLESNYLKRPLHKYYLITSISVDRNCKLGRRRINNCTISFIPFLPKVYLDGISQIEKSAQHSIKGDFPKKYIYVKVGVSAKSHAEWK
jgi:hypothetical protein